MSVALGDRQQENFPKVSGLISKFQGGQIQKTSKNCKTTAKLVKAERKLSIIENSDEWYLRELKKALGDFYNTMLIEKDDEILIRFLIFTEYDLDEAVQMVHSSDEMIRTQEHLLRIPFHSEIQPLFNHEAIRNHQGILVFKQRDHEGRQVVLFKARYYDPDEVDFDHGGVALSYGLDELMKSIDNQKNGFVAILDCTGVTHMKSAYILSKITRQQILMGIKAYNYTFPVKIGGVFTVNTPLVGAATYNAFKYLIKKKLRDRIHVNYGGPKALHKYFSKDFLPKSLLGNVPDADCQDVEFFKRLQKKKCRFIEFQS